jgi:hypothetical protein
MTNPQWLIWALDHARRDLIDLTRRNRLLPRPTWGKSPVVAWPSPVARRMQFSKPSTDKKRFAVIRLQHAKLISMNSDRSLSCRRLNQSVEKADRQIDELNFTRAYPLINLKSASQRFFASNERSKRSRAAAPFNWLWDFYGGLIARTPRSLLHRYFFLPSP